MQGKQKLIGIGFGLMLPVALLSCKREERGFKVQPPSAETIESFQLSDLQPGPTPSEIASNLGRTNLTVTNATNVIVTNVASTNLISTNAGSTNRLPSSTNKSSGPVKNSYEQNAYALSEGQQLYSYFNCVGCHAHGGGGMGPALMDDKWIYGSNPEQIFATIVEGRPNGMPSFRGKVPDYQVWMLAAYVRSLSGLIPKDAAPGREDHISGKKPENSTPPQKPKNSQAPKS